MELFKDAFNIAIVFAIGGSLLGSLIATDSKRYGIAWLYGGVGVFCGIVSPALLDALKGMAPKAIQRLINALCNRAEKIIQDKKDN